MAHCLHVHVQCTAYIHYAIPSPAHTVRVHLLPGVMVQELAVSVRSSDDSYMPKVMAVSVGSSESSLREIKTINIPRSEVRGHSSNSDLCSVRVPFCE